MIATIGLRKPTALRTKVSNMGKAFKTERYRHNRANDQVFWDIYHYHGGTKIYRLRMPCPKGSPVMKPNGRTLKSYATALVIVEHRGGGPRAPLKNKANAQEKTENPPWQDQWKGWWNRWQNSRKFYHLEAVV